MPKITKKVTKKTSKKKAHRSPSKRTTKKHTIPGPVKIESLKEFIINNNDDEEKSIIDYVEWQAGKDKEKKFRYGI